MVVLMSFAAASKIIILLIWPFLFMLIFYFKDKEKFKKKFNEIVKKD